MWWFDPETLLLIMFPKEIFRNEDKDLCSRLCAAVLITIVNPWSPLHNKYWEIDYIDGSLTTNRTFKSHLIILRVSGRLYDVHVMLLCQVKMEDYIALSLCSICLSACLSVHLYICVCVCREHTLSKYMTQEIYMGVCTFLCVCYQQIFWNF